MARATGVGERFDIERRVIETISTDPSAAVNVGPFVDSINLVPGRYETVVAVSTPVTYSVVETLALGADETINVIVTI